MEKEAKYRKKNYEGLIDDGKREINVKTGRM